MAASTVRLKGRREIARGTMAFHLEKPPGFAYRAGQFCELALIQPPETDGEGNSRAFTLASAPHEDDLMVATRMRDTAFKRVLKSLPLGTELLLDGPFGSFTLHGDATIPAVFLAGGIGVTPARSIALQAAHDRLPHRVTLFDSNRTPADAAFLDEFTRARTANPNFMFVATMSEPAGGDWKGETGVITGEMVRKFVTDLNAPIYYLSGPNAMVVAMRTLLEQAGVRDHMIRTEEFSGY